MSPFTSESAKSAGRKGNQKRLEAERLHKAQKQAVREERAQRPAPSFPSIEVQVKHAEKARFFAKSQPGKVEITGKPSGHLLWCSCGNTTVAMGAVCMDGHLPQKMRWRDHTSPR